MRKWPGAAALAAAVIVAAAGVADARPGQTAMFAGAGSMAVGAFAVATWQLSRKHPPANEFEAQLASAIAEWRAGNQAPLEGVIAEAAGPAAAAHSLRSTTLCDHMAGQLAVRPEEVPELMLAAALHALPLSRAGAARMPCVHSPEALASMTSLLARVGGPRLARTIGECAERWDGAGMPNALAGEECSLAGRILATVCAFDHASSEGLNPGLAVISAGSSSQFDPVVAAELLHLFREPWQLRQVA